MKLFNVMMNSETVLGSGTVKAAKNDPETAEPEVARIGTLRNMRNADGPHHKPPGQRSKNRPPVRCHQPTLSAPQHMPELGRHARGRRTGGRALSSRSRKAP